MADERVKISQLPKVVNIQNFEVAGFDRSTNASAKADMEQLRGNTGATGASPVIQNGTVSTGAPGSAATLTLTPTGTTPEGAPLYTLSGSIPQGLNGVPPVLQNGTISTGAPGSEVSLTLTPNGSTPGGNPIYTIDGSIPEGQPGTGSGNVEITTEGLVEGNRYVFVPSGNNSGQGTMVSASPIHKQVTLTSSQWTLQSASGLWVATITDTDVVNGALIIYAPNVATTSVYTDAGVYQVAEVAVGTIRLSASSQPVNNIDLLYTIQL